MKHLLDITDMSVSEIDALVNQAENIMKNREAYAHALDGKTLATLFFEPSTRTRLSFEAAMLELEAEFWDFLPQTVRAPQRAKRSATRRAS